MAVAREARALMGSEGTGDAQAASSGKAGGGGGKGGDGGALLPLLLLSSAPLQPTRCPTCSHCHRRRHRYLAPPHTAPRPPASAPARRPQPSSAPCCPLSHRLSLSTPWGCPRESPPRGSQRSPVELLELPLMRRFKAQRMLSSKTWNGSFASRRTF